MKKLKGYFFVGFLSVLGICIALYCLKKSDIGNNNFYEHTLIQENGNISDGLSKIFEVLNISTKGKNLLEIYKIFYEKYGLKKNQERWQLEKKDEEKKLLLMPIFEKLGIVQEILPASKNYKTIIILGASVGRMRKRVAFLQNLWEHGIRAERIVFFAGERLLVQDLEEEKNPLDESVSSVPFREGWTAPSVIPKSEAEVAPIIWDQIIVHKELREVPVLYISAPYVKDSKTQEMRRPNTGDLVRAWLTTHPPSPGKYMAISNNPYVYYQDQSIRNQPAIASR